MFKEINKYEGNLLKDEIVANFYEFVILSFLCSIKFVHFLIYWYIGKKSLYASDIYCIEPKKDRQIKGRILLL